MKMPRPDWPIWLLLATPAVRLLVQARAMDADYDALTASSGIWAAGFLLAALAVTPLAGLAPRTMALRWLVRQRRAIGLTAFGLGLVHLGLYILAMGTGAAIWAEAGATGIWTGWAALALLLSLALTSNGAAMRALGRGWKRVQRLAYPAAVLALLHWALVHDGWRAALVTGTALLLLRLTQFLPKRRFA